jgi:hypothetical protein
MVGRGHGTHDCTRHSFKDEPHMQSRLASDKAAAFAEPAVTLHIDKLPGFHRPIPRRYGVIAVVAVITVATVWLRTVAELNNLVAYRPAGCQALANAPIHAGSPEPGKDAIFPRPHTARPPMVPNVSCARTSTWPTERDTLMRTGSVYPSAGYAAVRPRSRGGGTPANADWSARTGDLFASRKPTMQTR